MMNYFQQKMNNKKAFYKPFLFLCFNRKLVILLNEIEKNVKIKIGDKDG